MMGRQDWPRGGSKDGYPTDWGTSHQLVSIPIYVHSYPRLRSAAVSGCHRSSLQSTIGYRVQCTTAPPIAPCGWECSTPRCYVVGTKARVRSKPHGLLLVFRLCKRNLYSEQGTFEPWTMVLRTNPYVSLSSSLCLGHEYGV